MKRLITQRYLLILALTVFVLQPCADIHAQSYDKLSPFSEVRWTDNGLPEARIDDQWYAVKAINDVAVKEIMEYCNETWPDKARRRFEEDLVEVLSRIGHSPDHTVTLNVTNLQTKADEKLSDVKMTRENRLALRKAREVSDYVRGSLDDFDKNGDGQIQLDEVPSDDRDDFLKVDTDSNKILTASELAAYYRESTARPSVKTSVTADQAIADIDDFQRQLEERFAYLHANHADYKSALDAIRKRIHETADKPVDVSDLEAEIGKVVSMFIDGHARPRGKAHSTERIPFFMDTAGDRFVAVNFDRKSLLDSEHPYVVSLDGVDLERWLVVMDSFVNVGSPQFVRRRMLRDVRKNVDYCREQLKLPVNDELQVGLATEDGTRRVVRAISLTDESPAGAEMAERECGIVDGNIGYLSIPSFSRGGLRLGDATNRVQKWMPQFKETHGLIIDVRNNTGGSRRALMELFPYLLKPGEAHIGNVCAYRLYREFDDDHLAARYAWRESDERWDENERAAIRKFKASFQPEWEIPKEDFSDWHYLLLSKRADDKRYHYNKPVVLLTNSSCFSATDIFVGAFKGFRNVTIMGQSTGGGSARSQIEYLPNSGIRIRLASMASFQPNGLLYDGRGVTVDISVDPSPESFLIGGEDNVLQAAIDFLKR